VEVPLKSTLDRPCRDVVITNCLLSSACNAFKLGTESNGGFVNVVLSNCSLYDTDLAGLALELVDGGRLEQVSISNVAMRNVNCPVFIRLGNRARPFKDGMAKPAQGTLRGISLSHVLATGANRIGCSITGLPGAPAENVSLEDINITFAGGGKAEDAQRPIAELAERYPEYSMFGLLPAYGFYCRHARGLRFSRVRLDCTEADHRPALVCDEVQDVELFGWRPVAASPASPVVRLKNVRDALLQGCHCPPGAVAFLRVEGKDSERIRLLGADLTGAQQPVEFAADAPPTAVVRPRD
jgi:polygalacturonase